jgi:hypothetical protein
MVTARGAIMGQTSYQAPCALDGSLTIRLWFRARRFAEDPRGFGAIEGGGEGCGLAFDRQKMTNEAKISLDASLESDTGSDRIGFDCVATIEAN